MAPCTCQIKNESFFACNDGHCRDLCLKASVQPALFCATFFNLFLFCSLYVKLLLPSGNKPVSTLVISFGSFYVKLLVPSSFGGPRQDAVFMGVLLGVLPKRHNMLHIISVYPVGILESLVQNRFILYHQFDLA